MHELESVRGWYLASGAGREGRRAEDKLYRLADVLGGRHVTVVAEFEGALPELPLPGQGSFDLTGLIRSVRQTGFDGPFGIEIFHPRFPCSPAADRGEQRLPVRGASRGIGRAIVEAAVARGDEVVAVVRSADAARSITEASDGNALAPVADVTRPDDVRSAVDQARRAFGGIDVLVNNAGYTLLAGVEEAADDQIRQQFETNVFGLIDVTRAVLPLLRRSAKGFIVAISSVAGVSASAGFAYYGASKHAVEGFAEGRSPSQAVTHGRRLWTCSPAVSLICVRSGLSRDRIGMTK